jgi:hypothetical protein
MEITKIPVLKNSHDIEIRCSNDNSGKSHAYDTAQIFKNISMKIMFSDMSCRMSVKLLEYPFLVKF